MTDEAMRRVLPQRSEEAQRAYEEAWATDRRTVFDAAIRRIEAEAALSAPAELDTLREALGWHQPVAKYDDSTTMVCGRCGLEWPCDATQALAALSIPKP